VVACPAENAAKAHRHSGPLLQFGEALFERREVLIDTEFNRLDKRPAELAAAGLGFGFGTKIEIGHRRSNEPTRVAVRRMSRPSIFRLRIVIRARISHLIDGNGTAQISPFTRPLPAQPGDLLKPLLDASSYRHPNPRSLA